MASKKTVTPDNLAALGVERLGAILVELADGDAEVKRRLRLELAAQEGGDSIAAEIGKRLTALRSARSFVDWQKHRDFVRDLDLQRAMIVDRVATTRADLALDLMWRFLDLAEPVINRVDDSNGSVGDVFRSACEDLGAIAVRAKPDSAVLADRVFTALLANDYGVYDGLVPVMLPALGDAGVEHLKSRLVQALADRKKGENGTGVQMPGAGPCRTSRMGRPMSTLTSRWCLRQSGAHRTQAPRSAAGFSLPAVQQRHSTRWSSPDRSGAPFAQPITTTFILPGLAAALRGRRPTSRHSTRRAGRTRRSGFAGRRSRSGSPPRTCVHTSSGCQTSRASRPRTGPCSMRSASVASQ